MDNNRIINESWALHWVFIVAMFVALVFKNTAGGIVMFGFVLINGKFLLDAIRKDKGKCV